MATDTLTPPDEDQDAIQQHYDDEFDALTSAEHQAKSGVPGDIGSDEEAGFYKGGDSESKPGKGKEKDGEGDKKQGSGEDDEPGFVKGELGGVASGGIGGAIGGFFKGKWTRRKSVTTGVISLVVVGSGIFGANIATGPFEFIHLAKLLEGFHFSAQEDQSDMKVSRIVRYIRDPSKPQNLRMSALANKYADKFEARIEASGIKSDYTGLRAAKTLSIDRENENWKGLSDEEVKAKLESMGVKPSMIKQSGGKISFDPGTGYFDNARINQEQLKLAGYSKISSWVGNRMLIKRAGVTLHPFKKLDQKLLDKANEALKAWQEERDTEISKGEQAALAETEGPPADKDGNPQDSPGSEEATSSNNEIAGEGTAAGDTKTPGPVQAFQDHLTTKIAGGGAAVVGIACMAKSVNDAATEEKQAKVILPLIRFGVDAMSSGGQLMANQDIDGTQVKYLHDLMYGKDSKGNTTSWADAQSIQANEGKTGGVAPNDTLTSIGKGGPFDKFFNATGVGAVMGAACSTAGQIIMTGFSLATGPISTIVGGVTSYFLEGKVVSYLAHWFVGKPIDAFATGADFGSQADYGALLAANDMAMAAGGVALNAAQVLALQSTSNTLQNNDFAHQSFAYKTFNANDPQTLASKVIDNSSGATHNVASFANLLTGLPHTFATSLGGMLTLGKAHAASAPYDYGVPVYGFSAADMESPVMTQPFSGAATQAAALLDGPNSDSYVSKAASCFGATIQKDSDNNWEVVANTTSVDAYSGKYDNAGCADSSQDWLAIRGFISYSETMDSMACWEGDAESCQNVGAAEAPSQSTTGAGTSFRIASYNMRVHTTSAQNQVAINNMKNNHFNVVGMQEVSYQSMFTSIKSKLQAINYDIYPEQYTDTWDMNSTAIAYDTSKFDFVKADSVTYPGGDHADCDPGPCQRPGIPTTSPVLWLKDKGTGQEVIVINVHWFAFGKTSEWDGPQIRKQASQILTSKVQSLQAEGLPIFITGDFNEGYGPDGTAFCMLYSQNLAISPFVDNPGNYCKPSGTSGGIDHILTSPGVQGTPNELTGVGPREADDVFPNLGTDHQHVPYADVVVAGNGTGGGNFNIASYNILGASHDSNWQPRADDVVKTVKSNSIDVIGAQEIQEVQRNYIVKKLGYGVFPSLGSPNTHYHTVNSILWNTDDYTQIGKGGYITGPKYFCGTPLDAPYVKLQSQETQQEFYVINTHDPATNAGPACSNPEQNKAERTANAKIYAAFIKDLKQKTGLPVFMTGDFNNGYDVNGSGANSPLNGQASNLTICIMEQGGQILDAYDSFKNRDAKCPNPIGSPDSARIAGGVDHLFLTNDAKVTDWQTIPGKQAGTDHDFLQIYSISLPGAGSGDEATISIDGVKNFRDASASNSVLKSKTLYRSGELSNMTPKGADKLSSLLGSNGTIIDLRRTAERNSAPDNNVQGSKDISIPIDNILDQRLMVTDPARRTQIGKALKAAANAKGPVLIHCSAGKDRTGWVVAMIMYNAGASDSQVMTEYMKSSDTFPGGVQKSWLNDGIDAIHSKYGSVNNYLKKGLGLSDGDLQKLNQKFGA